MTFAPDQVASVKVGTNRNMPNALIHHRPTTELQAKFSMEFCMAILLLERKAGLPEFTDEIVNRPDVQAMIQKVDFGVHPEAEAAGYDKMTTIIEINLTDGRRIGGRADFGKGSPSNPMSYDEVADKFRECAAYSRWPRQKAEQVIEVVRDLEGLRNICELDGASIPVDGGRGPEEERAGSSEPEQSAEVGTGTPGHRGRRGPGSGRDDPRPLLPRVSRSPVRVTGQDGIGPRLLSAWRRCPVAMP